MSNKNTKWIVGLTGGIGSGKSCVSDRLQSLGATVIDTDVIAHQLTKPGGEAVDSIFRSFGQDAIEQDGSMNRTFMREQITQSPKAREILERILHPMIRQKVQDEVEISTGCYVVVVVPLLVEKGGWLDWMDDIVVVDCPENLQIERVRRRNGWPLEQIKKMMSIQATRAQRLKIATEVVTNEHNLSHLLRETDELHEKLLLKASKISNNLQQNDR